MEKIFITDGRWHKTLAAVRSLGKKGIPVICGDNISLACSFFSRYCAEKFIYPSPKYNTKEFIERLIKEFEKKDYRVLFPMEEDTMQIIADNINAFPQKISIPIVDREKLLMVRDKGELIKFAISRGVPCPGTWFIKDIEEIKDLKLTFPVVIKPRVGSGAKGVKYIENKKELEENYRKIHSIFPYPLIQERIPSGGEAIGVSAVFDRNGVPVASFTHKRIREFPVSGGASTLCESCLRPEIEEIAIKLLRDLNWYGVAMVEFKVDPRDNIPKLMEINTRFWGSLQLAIYGGIDFPYLLYQIALNKKTEVSSYKIGVKFRWILPGDLMHFISNPERFRMKPDFFDFFDRNTTHAIFSWDDPLPVIGMILTGLSFLYDKDMKRHLLLKLGLAS